MNIREFRIEDMEEVIALYQACFREPPWFEEFDQVEVEKEFREILSWSDSVFLVCERGSQLLGGTIGFSLGRKPDVVKLVDSDQVFYLAEAFVSKASRRQGVYSSLVKERFKKALSLGYTSGVVRTSVSQSITQHMFIEKLGYKIIAEQDVISTKVVDGIMAQIPDKRIVMMGSI